MKTKLVVLGAVLLLVAGMACNLTSLIPVGGPAGTVSALWPDVPPFEGATRENIDMPLPIRVAMQAMLKGKLEFIVFTTNAAPRAVNDFYSKDRMAAAGWDADQSAGCGFGSSEEAQSEAPTGNMCFFSKREGGKEVGLVIMAVQDDNTKKTQIFYARVNLDATPQPSK